MYIKIFKDPYHKDVVKALDLYTKNIKEDWRTDTNEMMYWFHNYNNIHTDNLYFCGIYENDEIIGLYHFAHFKKQQIVFIDYIVIAEEYRIKNNFNIVVDKFFFLLKTENIDYKYILCEVENNIGNKRSLVKLYNRKNFKSFELDYNNPFLNINHKTSKLEYDYEINNNRYNLMVYTSDNIQQVNKFEFLDIINTIYYNHYRRWYEPFLNDEQGKEYNYHIDKLKNNIINMIEENNMNYIKII